MDYRNISLIGFMASGKSTTGKLLAKKLNMLFIDTDKIIQLKEGLSIPCIFDKHGQDYFRDVECEVIAKLYNNQNCVFACGGGVVEGGENTRIIKDNSLVIYLKVSSREAVKRAGGSKERPLLNVSGQKEEARKLLERREPAYNKLADISVNTDGIDPERVVNIIMGKLK